jgi:hypothetical protein
MFQLALVITTSIVRNQKQCIDARGTDSRLLRNSRVSDECAGTSKFSFSSEILEKSWEPDLKMAVTTG